MKPLLFLCFFAALTGCNAKPTVDDRGGDARAREAALREALKSGPLPIAEAAMAQVKKDAAGLFGMEVANKAIIAPDIKGIKEYETDHWKATGQFRDDAEGGKSLKLTWACNVELKSGDLRCQPAEFFDQDGRPYRATK